MTALTRAARVRTTDDPLGSLWRAAQAFRLVTAGYAVWVTASVNENYSRGRLAWLLIGLLVVWSGVAAVVLTLWRRFRMAVTIADLALAVALMLATRVVATPAWYEAHQSLPTTLWVSNAILSAALLWGAWGGLAAGLGLSLVSLWVSRSLGDWSDSTIPVLAATGLSIGLAASTVRSSARQLEQAVHLRAATLERERLSREVHDGVLQVLALVSRERGAYAGAAAEQERRLRELLSLQSRTTTQPDAAVDLGARLASLSSSVVTVSGPSEPVPLAGERAEELLRAVREALTNTERHAGPGARSYVLLEDLGTDLIVTVRDDGAGMPQGRLEQARAQGRMGVSGSIQRRLEQLGGRAHLVSAPTEGVEWELHLPKEGRE